MLIRQRMILRAMHYSTFSEKPRGFIKRNLGIEIQGNVCRMECRCGTVGKVEVGARVGVGFRPGLRSAEDPENRGACVINKVPWPFGPSSFFFARATAAV